MEFETLNLPTGHTVIIDKDDVEKINQYKWHLVGYKDKQYAQSTIKDPVNVLMHRFILCPPLGFDIDHINGNGLDNRKSNLRICTRSQNLQNQIRKSSNKTSQYKGVHFNKMKNKWIATIKKDGIATYLGSFTSEIKAATAYDKAANGLFGEFARLNFN